MMDLIYSSQTIQNVNHKLTQITLVLNLQFNLFILKVIEIKIPVTVFWYLQLVLGVIILQV